MKPATTIFTAISFMLGFLLHPHPRPLAVGELNASSLQRPPHSRDRFGGDDAGPQGRRFLAFGFDLHWHSEFSPQRSQGGIAQPSPVSHNLSEAWQCCRCQFRVATSPNGTQRCRRCGHYIAALLVAALLFSIAACNRAERLSQLSIGMSKPDAAQVLGTRYTVRGAMQTRYGQSVEVWEVVLSQPKTGKQVVGEVTATVITFGLLAPVLATPGREKAYWLYFVDGRLAQWGEAGDWAREADRIYEIRFR